jgi:hypothetical protein
VRQPCVVTCHTLDEYWQAIKPIEGYAPRRERLRLDFHPLLEALVRGVMPGAAGPVVADLFHHQFPAGLPFGLIKPHVVLRPQGGTQVIQFEDASDIWVIRTGVYPSLAFAGLEAALKGTPITRTALQAKLPSIIQTPTESTFFQQYAAAHRMFTEEVPVLVPQAWIQWHSLRKDDLRTAGSSYAAGRVRRRLDQGGVRSPCPEAGKPGGDRVFVRTCYLKSSDTRRVTRKHLAMSKCRNRRGS